MAQTSTWAVPSAPSGLAMRNTVNTMIDVLRSSSSGAAAPSPTVAGMFWFDESVSPAVLRIRNSSNTAWIRIIDTADAAASRTALGITPLTNGVIIGTRMLQWGNVFATSPGVTVVFPQTFGSLSAVLVSANNTGANIATFQGQLNGSVYIQNWDAAGNFSNGTVFWQAMGSV